MRRLVLILVLALAGRLEAATLIAGANGNFTAAATWQLVDATSYLDSEAGTVVVGVGNIDSAAFIPGAITVDGIAVKVSSRAAVPGANTFTVTLRNTTAGADVAAVTINVSDINAVSPGGWYFVNFGNQLLVAGDSYIVRCVASAAAMVTLYRNATANNVSRMLRTSTTQAPAAGDQFHVTGEWTAAATVTTRTVTMEETAATSYGPTVAGGPPQGATIGNNGTLTWATAAATTYVFYLKGIMRVYPGGTMSLGTAGTPMPSTSTAEYRMASVANVDSGLVVDGTLNVYGATKTVTQTLLTADVAGAGTTLQVTSTAGWAASDVLAIASTTQTAAQCEQVTVKSVDSGVQVTLAAGVAAAHSGTSPTQAEVVNLTRNVVMRGVAAATQGYFLFSATSTVAMRYAELTLIGSGTLGFVGLEPRTTTGSADMQFLSLHDWSNGGRVYLNGVALANITFSNNSAHLASGSYWVDIASGVTASVTMDHNILMESASNGVNSSDLGMTFTNNTVVGAGSYGWSGGEAALVGTWSGNTFHSNNTGGMQITTSAPASGSVFSTMTAWRNGGNGGLLLNGLDISGTVTFGLTAFGNGNRSVFMFNVNVYGALVFNTLVSNGDSTFATTTGIDVQGGRQGEIRLIDSNLSTAAGIKTAHTNDLSGPSLPIVFKAYNSIFAAATTFSGIANDPDFGPTVLSGLYSMKHGQVAGDHRRFLRMGNALTDTVTFRTASPSEELVPSSASVKMQSGPKQAAVASGNAVTWSVWVQKAVGYAGAQPRLILRANPAIGINADTVLDTMAGGAGVWEELTGVTPAAAGDAGVFEAFVDCDTSGSIFIDDWSVNGTLISENRGWWQGTPMIVAGGQPIGGDTYWWTAVPAVGFPPAGPAPGGAVPIINNPILISRRGVKLQ